MHYPQVEQGEFTVISLHGEVDLHQSPQARRQILNCLGQARNLLVDLSQVEYIDSSGVASLVEGLQLAKGRNLKFALVGVSESAMRVLKLARLDTIFPIHASVAELLLESD